MLSPQHLYMTDDLTSTQGVVGTKLHPFLIVATFLLFSFLSLYRLGYEDLGTDEGRFGLSAINILTDHRQLATMSEDPLGSPGTKPFMYPLSLVPSILLFGPTEFALRLTSVLLLAGAGFLLYVIVALYFTDPWLAALTVLFFLLNPWTVTYARGAMPEPAVIFWGCAALLAAARFSQRPGLASASLCGLALGLGFLAKMWLIYSFAFCCAAILVGTLIAKPSLRILLFSLFAFLFFVVTGAAHILLVLWLTPRDLHHWLQLYLIGYLQSRVAGDVTYDPAMWFHPWWFYFVGFFKATVFALPLFPLGLYSIARRRQFALLTVILVLLSPLLFFSLLRVKQTSYVYSTFPAVAFVLACGFVKLLRRDALGPLIIAVLISIAAAFLAYTGGVIEPKQLIIAWTLYMLFLVTGMVRLKYTKASQTILAATMVGAMLFADSRVLSQSSTHRTYFRDIARFFAPLLKSHKPQETVFRAPEFAALEFYTFRSGGYWQTHRIHQDSASFLKEIKEAPLLFYVVDPRGGLYGGSISKDKLRELGQYAVDVTQQVERVEAVRLESLRIFVVKSQLGRIAEAYSVPISQVSSN